MNVTLSFTLTPAERRLSLRTWSYLGLLRSSLVGLPIALAGIGLVSWRIKPGAPSGWAVIVLVLGLGSLAAPQITLTRDLIGAKRRARTGSGQVHVTLTDALLKYERDEVASQLPWRHVSQIRAAADCWVISIRTSPTALVIPKRAISAAVEPEIAQFFRQLRSPVPGRAPV